MGEEAAPAHLRIQLAAELENAIADRFGFETAQVLTPQKIIGWIGLVRDWILTAGGHAISIGQENELLHFLQRPSLLDEGRRQPVQQPGICRWEAGTTKISRRLDDAFAEMMLPKAVHHDAGGERIVRAGDPFCKRQASATGGGIRTARGQGGFLAAEHGEEGWLYFRARGGGVAAHEDMSGERLSSPLAHGQRPLERRGFFLEATELFLSFLLLALGGGLDLSFRGFNLLQPLLLPFLDALRGC